MGARTLEINKAEYVVRGLGFIRSPADLEEVVIANREHTPIRVRDVAKVGFGPAQRRGALDVGGAPEALKPMLEKHGRVFDAPRAHCDKARRDLGLETHAIEDTLRETGRTLIELGLVEPKAR